MKMNKDIIKAYENYVEIVFMTRRWIVNMRAKKCVGEWIRRHQLFLCGLLFLFSFGLLLFSSNINIHPQGEDDFWLQIRLVDNYGGCIKQEFPMDFKFNLSSDFIGAGLKLNFCENFNGGGINIHSSQILSGEVNILQLNKSYFLGDGGGFCNFTDIVDIIDKDKRYTLSIILEVKDDFYDRFRISTDGITKGIGDTNFYYPNKKYLCTNCFSIIEGSMSDFFLSHKEEDKAYFNFNQSKNVVVLFNPISKGLKILKEFSFGLSVSLIAGLILIFFEKTSRRKNENE